MSGSSSDKEEEEERLLDETLDVVNNEKTKETRKLCVDVLTNNRNLANGMVIENIAPKLVDAEIKIEIEEEDIEYDVKFW